MWPRKALKKRIDKKLKYYLGLVLIGNAGTPLGHIFKWAWHIRFLNSFPTKDALGVKHKCLKDLCAATCLNSNHPNGYSNVEAFHLIVASSYEDAHLIKRRRKIRKKGGKRGKGLWMNLYICHSHRALTYMHDMIIHYPVSVRFLAHFSILIQPFTQKSGDKTKAPRFNFLHWCMDTNHMIYGVWFMDMYKSRLVCTSLQLENIQ